VSEESGQISLALDGRIERGLTPEELRARLRALVVQRRSQLDRGPQTVAVGAGERR